MDQSKSFPSSLTAKQFPSPGSSPFIDTQKMIEADVRPSSGSQFLKGSSPKNSSQSQGIVTGKPCDSPSSPSPLDEPIDPRVQVELENLNTLTDLINKLELELDDSRAVFRQVLTESTNQLKSLAKSLGSSVEKARPYYEARIRAKELQNETQKAAVRYERAVSAHLAAKEMVSLSEEGLSEEGRIFDPAWQEMLNHATARVNAAEEERAASEFEHLRTSRAYNEAENVVSLLASKLKRTIAKARYEICVTLLFTFDLFDIFLENLSVFVVSLMD